MSGELERIYPLKNLGSGEYELLGNDGETLWRIYSYGWEVPAWGLRRQRGPLGRWEKVGEYPFQFRKDAIEALLKLERAEPGGVG